MVPKTQPRVLSASTLSSDRVKNLQGEDLGHVKDLMIDLESGRIAYAVLSFGGILGMGDKLFAVPWRSLEVDTDQKCLLLDADKERLKNAPGFDKNHWPKTDDLTWQRQIHTYYEQEPYWEQTQNYQG
jgi:sporulation protein YlmC with PRC-barrel domain